MMFQRNEMIELLQNESTLAETITVRAQRLPDHTAIVFNQPPR